MFCPCLLGALNGIEAPSGKWCTPLLPVDFPDGSLADCRQDVGPATSYAVNGAGDHKTVQGTADVRESFMHPKCS